MSTRASSWLEPTLRNRFLGIVLTMLVVVPLIAIPLGNRFRGTEALVVELFSMILLASLLWTVSWKFDKEQVFEFLKKGANLPVLLYLLYTAVSCLFSPEKQYGIQETMRVGSGVILYFVVAYRFRRSEHLTRLSDAILFITGVISFIGLVLYSQSIGTFATGPFGEHQLYGSLLMILLPIVAIVAVTEKTPARQLVAQVIATLAAASLLLAHSRSAWAGAAVSLVALVLLSLVLVKKKNGSSRPRHLHEYLPSVLLIAVAVGFFLLISPSTSSIMGRLSTFSTLSQENSWKERQAAWQGAASMIRARPITGFGAGMYPYLQHNYTGVGNAISNLNGLRPSLGEQAHNLYLQTAAELGIPGLLLFLSIIVVFFAKGAMRLKDLDQGVRRNLLLASMAAMAGVLVDAYSSPSWQLGQMSIFLWLMLGIGVNCMQPQSKRPESAVADAPRGLSRASSVFATIACCILLPTIAVAGGGDYTNLASVKLYYKLFQGDALHGFPPPITLKSGHSVDFFLTARFTDSTGMYEQFCDVTSASSFSASPSSLGAFAANTLSTRARTAGSITVVGSYTGGSPVHTVTDTGRVNLAR